MFLFCFKKTKKKDVQGNGESPIRPNMVEDGFGMHTLNMSPLVRYQSSPPGFNRHEVNHREQQMTTHFDQAEMNQYCDRRSSSTHDPHAGAAAVTNKEQILAANKSLTTAIVRPENPRRSYSSSSSSSVPKNNEKRYSVSTTVPTIQEMENMRSRGYSIDTRVEGHNYSEETPRNPHPLVRHRNSASSYNDFEGNARRRKSLQPLHETFPTDQFFTTGSQYSHPGKPAASAVKLPSVSIQPQLYDNHQHHYRQNESSNLYDYNLSNDFHPLKSSTPRRQYSDAHFIAPSTFETQHLRRSTPYLADIDGDGNFSRRQLSSEVLSHQGSNNYSNQHQDNDDEEEHHIHSPMSNSGHSSSAATTTTTTDTVMPTFFNNHGSSMNNKVAVAPQPQKRSSHRHSNAKEETPRLRTHVSYSPYNQLPTSNGLPTSRSGNRINRLSSEVFIDGPSPSTPDGHTDVRVSMLEEKVRELEMKNSPNTRQNMSFSAPSDALRLLMGEIVEKDIMIGTLKTRIQGLASQMERQQFENDTEKRMLQKELGECRNKHQSVKKKLQSLTEQMDSDQVEIAKVKKDLLDAKEQIRLRDSQISALSQRVKSAGDAEMVTKLREDIRAKDHQSSLMQDELVSRDARIKELERKLEESKRQDDFKKRVASSPNAKTLNPDFKRPIVCGFETLPESDTDDDGKY